MSNNESPFVKARNALEAWFEHLWNTETVQSIAKNTENGGEQVVKTALTTTAAAMMISKTTGGDKDAVEKAGKDAFVGSLKTVGVTVGTDVVEKAVTQISSTIHGDTGGAQQPPV
jgi:hypothetical protein